MSLDAEYAVLGAVLVNNDCFWKVADKIGPEDFAEPIHRRLFALMRDEIRAGRTVDFITLLDAGETGLSEYAVQLASTQASTANVAAYADAVARQAEGRRLRSAGAKIAACGSFEEAQAVLAEVRPRQTQALKSMKDGLREMVEALQRRYDADGTVSGVPTGLESLDALTSGWQAGDLVIAAARPSMGKTSFALQAAIAAGRTLMFSLEMTTGRLVERLVANVGRLPLRWILFPLDAPDDASARVLAASTEAAKLPLLFDDTAGLTVDAICSRARQAHMQEPLNLVVVDHLGLISRPGRHDPSELGQITTQLKALAKALGIPVLLLCQLNRGVESRNDKRPMLSDLRDSGRIEEDADTVIGLYRDEYYHKDGPLAGYLEAIVLKQRQGELGTAWARSMLSMMRLESCDEPERPTETTGPIGGSRGFQARGRASTGSRYLPGTDRHHG